MSNKNLAYGDHMEPFGGITTFMRQPASRDFEDVDVAVVGIPFDGGAAQRSGTRFGPRKIRESSLGIYGYNPVLKVTPLDKFNLIDYGDVEVVPVDISATQKAINEEVGALLEKGIKVISLGGDHSVTLPLLRAHSKVHGPLAVIHFDSHSDTWEGEYGEEYPYTHATPFRRAIEENLIDLSAFIQIGIRGSLYASSDLDDARALGAEIVTIDEAFNVGVESVIKRCHELVEERPVYISLDIDSVDPAFAPGTGSPEIGGFTSYQIVQLLRGLKNMNLIGFDLVEVCPLYDHGEITSLLAVNLAFEYLSLLALS